MKTKNNLGFTIVELLIVIVVIGILAAITVVAYNGIQNRANNTAVQADLRNINSQLAMYRTINSTYPGTLTQLNSVDIRVTQSAYAGAPEEVMNVTYCINSDASEFTLFAYAKSRTLYAVDHNNVVRTIPSANISTCGGIAGLSRTGTDGLNIDAGYYNGDWRPWTR